MLTRFAIKTEFSTYRIIDVYRCNMFLSIENFALTVLRRQLWLCTIILVKYCRI